MKSKIYLGTGSICLRYLVVKSETKQDPVPETGSKIDQGPVRFSRDRSCRTSDSCKEEGEGSSILRIWSRSTPH